MKPPRPGVYHARVSAILTTDLALPGRRQGKVRDVYDLPASSAGLNGPHPRLLMVATDRISAFDVVMPTPIEGKGELLTKMSAKWFGFIETRGLCRTHMISTDLHELESTLGSTECRRLMGRAMIVRRCRVVPVECVVRGYLDGSGWSEYRDTGRVCGVVLPPGLRRGDRLPQPIFTPATKEAIGKHDENIDFERACAIAGGDTMNRLRDLSLSIYTSAHEHARDRGLILADTKFEFGFAQRADGSDAEPEPRVVDEALTPDSSRYWEASKWQPGGEQPSFDKQFLREYLNGLVARGEWNKQAPGPALPAEVSAGTAARYREVLARLWGG